MASSSQQRCVFVGNIPYDATEEQLIEICREVGPVVSFRLVIDRETGKPKGYGFCEYKDEETALSARRNLQGYEINGRQLRVDFAENDKNADRNREQSRGGPGLSAIVDQQKQVGVSAILGESSQHQPIGLHIAMTAATVMAGALGGAQTGMQSNQGVLQNQSAAASDPLTFHLAKMSRGQLNEIMSDMKVMATQNKEAARQLLLAKPQLLKALFQAQIMLGMVTPQVLQMPNIRQTLGQLAMHSSQEARQQVVQTIPALPPLAQKSHLGLPTKFQQGQSSLMPHNSSMHNQFSAPPQLPIRLQSQIPQNVNNMLQQATLPLQPGVVPLPPVQHPSIRPAIPMPSSALNQQIQPPFQQHIRPTVTAKFGHNSQMVCPNTAMQPSPVVHPAASDTTFQPGPLITEGNLDAVSSNADRSAQIFGDAKWGHKNNVLSNMCTNMVSNSNEAVNRPSKLQKLDGGKTALNGGFNLADPNGVVSSQSFAVGSSASPLTRSKEPHYSDKQVSLLSPDVESALLQQVLNLTPEQLSSLPPEQREQVIQLQQVLWRDQMQPS